MSSDIFFFFFATVLNSEAEVGNFEIVAFVKQTVFQFKVEVSNVAVMEVLHGRNELVTVKFGKLLREIISSLLDEVEDFSIGHEFSHNWSGSELSNVSNDVRMGDILKGIYFFLKEFKVLLLVLFKGVLLFVDRTFVNIGGFSLSDFLTNFNFEGI